MPIECKCLQGKTPKAKLIFCLLQQFDKQSGDFNLYILELAAFQAQQSTFSSGFFGFFAWLRNWFLSIFSLRTHGRGHIRL